MPGLVVADPAILTVDAPDGTPVSIGIGGKPNVIGTVLANQFVLNDAVGDVINWVMVGEGAYFDGYSVTELYDAMWLGTPDASASRTWPFLADNSVTEGAIAPGAVTARTIAANAITADKIGTGIMSAEISLTGAIIAGDPGGGHIVVDEDGFRQYASATDILINFPTDPSQPNQFEGTVIANALTTGNFTLQGPGNTVAMAAELRVSSGTTAPASPVSVAVGYETFNQTRWNAGALYFPVGVYADLDDTNEMLGAMSFYGYGKVFGRSDKWWVGPEYVDSNGTKRSKYGNIGSAVAVYTGTAERLVINSVYTTGTGAVATGKLTSLDLTPMTSSGTVEPLQRGQINAKMDDFLFQIKIGRVLGPNAGPSFADRYAMALNNWNSTVYDAGMITLRQYSVTDTAMAFVAGTERVITSPLAADEQLIGVTHGYTDKMLFPGTVQYVWLVHGSIKTYAYTATGTRLPDYDFPTPSGASRMMAWGNIATNGFLGFRTVIHSDGSPITKLTNNHWVTGTSDKWWVSSTWYDSDVTGGTHETAQGTRSVITMKKRAGLTFTVPTYPERPFPTTTDDVIAARVYLGRGNTDPGRTNMERVAELAVPNRSGFVGTYTFPGGAAVAPPPITSNFPATSPGKVASADGIGWVLSGDGTATLAGVTFDATKPGFASSAMRALEFRYTDATGLSVVSATPAAAGIYGGAGTFVAPPSGAVLVGFGGLTKSRADGQWVGIGVEVRTGSTIGSGTSVLAWSTNEGALNYNVNLTAVHRERLVTGLTPGDTYNVRMVVASVDTTAGAQLFRGTVHVTPVA